MFNQVRIGKKSLSFVLFKNKSVYLEVEIKDTLEVLDEDIQRMIKLSNLVDERDPEFDKSIEKYHESKSERSNN